MPRTLQERVMRLALLSWLLAALGCTGAPVAAPEAATTLSGVEPDWVPELHDRGLGPLHVGMPVAEVERILEGLGRGVERLHAPFPPDPLCDYLAPAAPGVPFALMVVEGEVVRIETESTLIQTPLGVGVMSSLEQVRAAYPEATEELHDYVAGHVISVPRPGGLILVFETMEHGEDIELVTSLRIGRMPEVAYIEGCS